MIKLLMFFGELMLLMFLILWTAHPLPVDNNAFMVVWNVVITYLFGVFFFVINENIVEFHDRKVKEEVVGIFMSYKANEKKASSVEYEKENTK